VIASMTDEILVMHMMESLGVWRTLVTPVIAQMAEGFGDSCESITKEKILVTPVTESQRVGFW
jgi:hypothetical protein